MKKKTRVLTLLPGYGKKEQLERTPDNREPETLAHAIASHSSDTLSFDYLDTIPWISHTSIRALDKLLALIGALVQFPRLLSYDVVLSSDTGVAECLASLWHKATRGKGPRCFLIALNTSNTSRRLQTKPFRLCLLQFCWRQYAEILCLAHFQMEDFVAAGVPSERLMYVPLGVDVNFFHYSGEQQEGEYILSVGFDLGRDYEYLLRIAEHVSQPIIIIASPQNISRDTHLPPNVTVRYNVPMLEFRNTLAFARMVVIPTKEHVDVGSDCSGQTVLLQALAMGKPVCATVRPWLLEYLQENKEYIALPPNDPSAAAQALESLWNDATRRAELEQAGRLAVEERYTIHIWAKAIVEQLLNRNKYPTKN